MQSPAQPAGFFLRIQTYFEALHEYTDKVI